MKLLMLGGTRFLGKTIVETAVTRGHEVTLFNRGNNPELFPGLEQLVGDRDGGLDALTNRSWDAVIDTSGYVPRIVNQSLRALKDQVGHYTFISTIDVYDESVPGEISETHPVHALEDESIEDIQKAYGPMKARCEQLVQRQMEGRALIVRCGLIAGPGDHTDRFTYWPRRMARGSEVLAPGNPDAPVQFIDVRDLSEWIVRKAEERHAGLYTATGPSEPITLGRLLDVCARTLGSDARPIWMPDSFLQEHEVGSWIEMPLWIPEDANLHALMKINVGRAIEAGLTYRPLETTIMDTLLWDRSRPEDTERKAGLAEAKETKLLKLWKTRSSESSGGVASMPRGETERLLLYKPDIVRDLDAHAQMMDDEEVGRWLPKGAAYTREETERLIRHFMSHWEERGYGAWAVYSKQTGQFLGHCGLNLVQDMGLTEVLYAFTREARGNGYCTEAASAALDLAFSQLGLDTVIGLAKQGNAPSIAVMKRLGMTCTDRLQWRGMELDRYEINRMTFRRS